MKKKRILWGITAPALLLFASLSGFSIASAQSQLPATAGKALTPAQDAVRHGEAELNKKVKGFNNLGEWLSADVQLHEQNGFKFGGLTFSTDDGTNVTKYILSKDVLHKEVYTKDQSGQLKNISKEDLPSFDPSNNSKFSKLTPGLLNVLSSISLHKNSEPVNSNVAHADTATSYDASQGSSYLSFWQSMYYFGDGYHDVDISSHNSWTGTGCGCADPGPKDGLDVEWNPNNLYMGSVVWQPNTQTDGGPFGYSGEHDIAIDDSTEYYGTNGGYYVEPDHNSQTNYVEVYLYPVSDSVIGQTSNYYGNYIHTWNWYGGTYIGFSIAYGAFSIQASSNFTGSYKVNNWGTYTI